MAVKLGAFDSPLGKERTLRFLKAQDKALTAAEPLTQQLLGQTLEATEIFGPPLPPEEPLFNLAGPQIQEPQVFGPQPGTSPAFGLQPPQIEEPPFNLGAPQIQAPEGGGGGLFGNLLGAFGQAVDFLGGLPLPGGPITLAPGARAPRTQTVSEVAEFERDVFQPVTRPASRFLTKAVIAGAPGPAGAIARGLDTATGGGFSEAAGELGADIGGELLLPTNLIPIPVVDPALARLLGITAKMAKGVSRVTLEALGKRAGDIAVAEGDTLLGTVARQFQDDAATLVQERPLAGAAEPPGTPPATSPTGTQLPDRGRAAAQEALNLKEETLLRPGRATQLPGIKQAVSGLNPSVSIDREVLVSYNARQAVNATLETEFAALRLETVRGLQGAWDAAPPSYTGPKNNAIKNTIKDWADNPDFYSGVSPELRAAAKAYDDVSNQILARTRGDYGVDIRAFAGKEGSFYLPTVAGRETLDASLLKVSDGYTSASVSHGGPRARTRVYEGAFQREQRNPGFQAETDLAELTSLHDRALASMSGNETLRLGAGGRTRLDVMQELHPDLFAGMTALRLRLANLRGTAGRLNERVGVAIDDFLTAPDGELSNLADALDVTVSRGRLKGANVKAVNAEIGNVRQEIRALRPAWEAANLEPFVLNRKTFRYHTAEQSSAIDKILLTNLPMGDGLLGAIDEVRLFAFAGDVSPLTIQGLLGILADPVTGARSLPGAARTLLSPENLVEIAARESALVARYTQATGRPFGQLGTEFVQRAKGIERIPGGRQLNDRLMATVELIRYNQWKTDTMLVQKLGGQTANVADAEAANALSKVIPALNPAERGASILQSRLERVPFISTSFIGGPATVVKDAVSGLAKLTTSRALSPVGRWQALAGREQLAILHLSSIAGTLVTASIATHIASGWSPEDAVKVTLDPGGPRFLSIALGGSRRIPLGGPLRSAVRAFVPRNVGSVEGVPVYVPFAGVSDWIKNKFTPALSTPFDLVTNKDYFGGKIGTGSFPEAQLRMLWYAVNNVLPLAVAEPSEALRRGEAEPTDIGRLAELSAAQFAGIDLRETSPFEQLGQARQAAMQEQGIPGRFDDLDPIQQARINQDPAVQAKQANLDAQPPRDLLGRGFDQLEIFRERQREAQLADDARLDAGTIPGDDWRDAHSGREREAFAQREAIKEFAGIEFADKEAQPGTVRAATDAWFDVDLEDFTDPETRARDWEGFNAARVEALALLTATQRRDFFDLVVGKFDTPRERDFRQATVLLNQAPSKVRGLTTAQHEEIKDFMRTVWAARRFWRAEGGIEYDDLTIGEAVAIVAEHQGKGDAFTRWAQALRSGVPGDLRAEEYDDYLIRHVDDIRLFYPDLYTSGRILDRLFQDSAAAG